MQVGDMVRIVPHGTPRSMWPEVEGKIGMIVALAKRLYIPAAKVMVLGQIAEFDLEELESVDAQN